jgi:acyl dehydratase
MEPASPTAVAYPDRIRTGEVIRTPSRTVSLSDIDDFARLTGDENPLHLDEEFARPRLFGGRVAHGMLTLSLTLGLWYRSRAFDDLIVVFSGIDKLRFLRAVRPEDALTAELAITRHDPSPRGDVVELDNTTFNQRKEPVLSFSARLLLARTP